MAQCGANENFQLAFIVLFSCLRLVFFVCLWVGVCQLIGTRTEEPIVSFLRALFSFEFKEGLYEGV
jgi:hypothetical protein